MRWQVTGPQHTAEVTTEPGKGITVASGSARGFLGKSLRDLCQEWHARKLEPLEPTNARIALITGSRKWTHVDRVFEALDKLNPAVLVTGGAYGVDTYAAAWALSKDRPCLVWPFDGSKGKAGGITRNLAMVEWLASSRWTNRRVLAFPLDGGTGTQHCMKVATQAGLEVTGVYL